MVRVDFGRRNPFSSRDSSRRRLGENRLGARDATQTFWGIIPDLSRVDLPPGGRVWEADDEGHGRVHAAPAHRRGAHSRGVFSRYATQLIDIPVPEPVGRGSSWDAE